MRNISKLAFALGAMFLSAGAFAEGKSDEQILEPTASNENLVHVKCMNFKRNKAAIEKFEAIEAEFNGKKFKEVQEQARLLLTEKLGCEQKNDIANLGYQSSIARFEFGPALEYLAVMREYQAKSNNDLRSLDQLTNWVVANRDARDPNIKIQDRKPIALRDRTMVYLYDYYKGFIPSGRCKVQFRISVYGQPKNIEVECAKKEVELPLKKYVPQMLFAPAILNGVPVEVESFVVNVKIE